MAHSTEVIEEVVRLKARGFSSRKIAQIVFDKSSSKSTVNDILRRESDKENKSLFLTNNEPKSLKRITPKTDEVFCIETSKTVGSNVTHLMIPDTQVKSGIDTDYLDHVGLYIAEKKPEVIVHIGDHADMPSLSSYDKGKKSAEGKRYYIDVKAAVDGMKRILRPLYELQQTELEVFGYVKYKPKMVFTLGNHEERIMRHADANPELEGLIGYHNLRYEEFGWEVYDFLEPAIINGVVYCHYMANPMTGKPYGGTSTNVLKNVGESFCMGHKQCLDVSTRFLPASGKQQWAIIAGACYSHDEGYKGHQGNLHWRGIVVKHNVKQGSFNPMFVNLDYLAQRYNGGNI